MLETSDVKIILLYTNSDPKWLVLHFMKGQILWRFSMSEVPGLTGISYHVYTGQHGHNWFDIIVHHPLRETQRLI